MYFKYRHILLGRFVVVFAVFFARGAIWHVEPQRLRIRQVIRFKMWDNSFGYDSTAAKETVPSLLPPVFFGVAPSGRVLFSLVWMGVSLLRGPPKSV